MSRIHRTWEFGYEWVRTGENYLFQLPIITIIFWPLLNYGQETEQISGWGFINSKLWKGEKQSQIGRQNRSRNHLCLLQSFQVLACALEDLKWCNSPSVSLITSLSAVTGSSFYCLKFSLYFCKTDFLKSKNEIES